jgi:hypothetical protein
MDIVPVAEVGRYTEYVQDDFFPCSEYIIKGRHYMSLLWRRIDFEIDHNRYYSYTEEERS